MNIPAGVKYLNSLKNTKRFVLEERSPFPKSHSHYFVLLQIAFCALVGVAVGAERGWSADTSLVAKWNFNEGAGTTAYDSSGHGNHGTIYGAAWTAGWLVSGLGFDGVDDYIEVPASTSLNSLTSQITVVAWVKTDFSQRVAIVERWYYDRTVLPNLGERVFVCTGETDPDKGKFAFGLSPNGDGSGGAWVTSETPAVFGQWTHVAFVSDGATMSIYQSGELSVSGPAPSSLHQSPMPMHLGVWKAVELDGSSWHYFKGVMDEIKIFNRALSAREIKADMENRSLTGPTITTARSGYVTPNPFMPKSGLLAHFNFHPAVPGASFTIRLMNLKGRIVRTLKNEFDWDGRDDSGNRCEAGVYLYQIETDGQRLGGTIALIQE